MGTDDDITGFKCYEFLQHRDAPCPFCTNRFLSREECYAWEYTNPITGVRHLLNDRLIDWNGRDARIEVGFEITARKEEGMRFRNLHQSEQIILDCVRALYRETDPDQAAEAMIRRLGTELKAHRTLILTHDGDRFSNTHEWCIDGIVPRQDELQNVEDAPYRRWIELFARGECVVIENLREIKDDIGPDEFRVLNDRGIDSIVAAPFERDGAFVGFLAIENPPGNVIRDIAPLLRTLCYFYMMTLQRIENRELLVQLSYHDSMTGLLNRNRYIEDVDGLAGWSGSLGVIFLDINGMKEINDRSGHAMGDRMLSECADTMRAVLGEAFSLYRIGGDEFVAIAAGIDEGPFRERVEALGGAFDQNPLCQVALGSRWEQSPRDVSSMLMDADEAMYRDKQLFYRNAIAASGSTEPRGAGEDMRRALGAMMTGRRDDGGAESSQRRAERLPIRWARGSRSTSWTMDSAWHGPIAGSTISQGSSRRRSRAHLQSRRGASAPAREPWCPKACKGSPKRPWRPARRDSPDSPACCTRAGPSRPCASSACSPTPGRTAGPSPSSCTSTRRSAHRAGSISSRRPAQEAERADLLPSESGCGRA